MGVGQSSYEKSKSNKHGHNAKVELIEFSRVLSALTNSSKVFVIFQGQEHENKLNFLKNAVHKQSSDHSGGKSI